MAVHPIMQGVLDAFIPPVPRSPYMALQSAITDYVTAALDNYEPCLATRREAEEGAQRIEALGRDAARFFDKYGSPNLAAEGVEHICDGLCMAGLEWEGGAILKAAIAAELHEQANPQKEAA